MVYENIVPAKFVSRPNRFIAEIDVDGVRKICHVKNTGRCRELLVPNADIFVQRFSGGSRKTEFDLISVIKNGRLINMDSQAPNKAVGEFLPRIFEGNIRSEVTYGSSRFDFCIDEGERRSFLEVKGVTLERDGAAYFPDAPTERGRKHLNELSEAAKAGFGAYVFFLVQMSDITHFSPNRETDPLFADALENAVKNGVRVMVYESIVTENSICVGKEADLKL